MVSRVKSSLSRRVGTTLNSAPGGLEKGGRGREGVLYHSEYSACAKDVKDVHSANGTHVLCVCCEAMCEAFIYRWCFRYEEEDVTLTIYEKNRI